MSQNVPVNNDNCQTEDQANSSHQNQYTFSSCNSRTSSTYRGLSQHNRHCAKRINVVSISSSQPVTISERVEVTSVLSPVTSFLWGERDGTLFTDDLNEAYEKIVFLRKNIFMLPTGNAGKKYIKEVTRLLNVITKDTPLRSVSLKAIHTMLAFLLKKPRKTLKRRDHLDDLERRLHLEKEVKLNLYY